MCVWGGGEGGGERGRGRVSSISCIPGSQQTNILYPFYVFRAISLLLFVFKYPKKVPKWVSNILHPW